MLSDLIGFLLMPITAYVFVDAVWGHLEALKVGKTRKLRMVLMLICGAVLFCASFYFWVSVDW